MTTSNASFRIARSLLLSAAVTLALAACGGGGGSGTQAGTPPGGSGDPGPASWPRTRPGPGPTAGPRSWRLRRTPDHLCRRPDDAGIDELYMVDPSAPGGSVKLSAPLVTGGNVYDFALSATASRSSTSPTRTSTRAMSCIA